MFGNGNLQVERTPNSFDELPIHNEIFWSCIL